VICANFRSVPNCKILLHIGSTLCEVGILTVGIEQGHHGIEQYLWYLTVFQFKFHAWLAEKRVMLIMDMLKVEEHELPT
jgi:hypothetical protein